MKVLVVNAGSSSLKFTVYRMAHERVLAKGLIERIGLPGTTFRYRREDGQSVERAVSVETHEEALGIVCTNLVGPATGVLDALSEVEAIGHRVVHGGEKFTGAALVTPEVTRSIQECCVLAPLHNPANLGAIQACERVFPGVPNVAVFDTAFHQSMPARSFLFAIPVEYYERDKIRKYGFHGTSHKFVSEATAAFLGQPLAELKLITCHLGNGASITAVDGGRVIETSMGMTPLAGLIMGTRSGDIDPGVVLYLQQTGMDLEAVDNLLNKRSGMLGLAGMGSSDMRDIIATADSGDAAAARALDMYVHRLVSYIGSYYVLLDGADALVFTGGVGENSALLRARVLQCLGSLGCRLDESRNQVRGTAALISTKDSNMAALVMPTDEELMIARETVKVACRQARPSD